MIIREVSISIALQTSAEQAWNFLGDFERCTLSGCVGDNSRILSPVRTGVGLARAVETDAGCALFDIVSRWDCGSGYVFLRTATSPAEAGLRPVRWTVSIKALAGHVCRVAITRLCELQEGRVRGRVARWRRLAQAKRELLRLVQNLKNQLNAAGDAPVFAVLGTHNTREADTLAALRIPGYEHQLALQVHPPGRDVFISEEIRSTGQWESFETQLLVNALQPGDTFVDAGANIGYYTVLAARILGPQGCVFAFEPDPENFRLLENNCAINGLSNVYPINAGLGRRFAKGALYLNPGNYGDHQTYGDGSGRDSIPIHLVSGAELVSQLADTVDFIKIDTQGAEVGVITGMAPLIANSLPALKMIVEFWPYGLARAGSGGYELLALLTSLGFSTFRIILEKSVELSPKGVKIA